MKLEENLLDSAAIAEGESGHDADHEKPSSYQGHPDGSSRVDRITFVDTYARQQMIMKEMMTTESWNDGTVFELLFKIKERETTVRKEIFAGLIQYFACSYFLAVLPTFAAKVGYNKDSIFISSAICSGVGCILCGIFANLPYIVAPPTIATIYLASFLQVQFSGDDDDDDHSRSACGSAGVFVSGFFLILLGYRPLLTFIGTLIPQSIQVGAGVGIGLLAALAGAVEVSLVVSGDDSIVALGKIDVANSIALTGVVFIAVALHYKVQSSFCLCMLLCTLVWWFYSSEYPKALTSIPEVRNLSPDGFVGISFMILSIDLFLLYVIFLNGLLASLSHLGHFERVDGTTPRARWLFIITGIATVISGSMTGIPVLISPESAAGIKAGAKTGMSTVVCGVLFLLSSFFAPIFDAVPPAATAPILIGIGILLFQNVSRIEWKIVEEAAPAFVVLFFIPFTYSLVQGVLIGYYTYVLITIFTGGWNVHFDFILTRMEAAMQCNLFTVTKAYFRTVFANDNVKTEATLDSFDVYNTTMRNHAGATVPVTRESMTSSMDVHRKSIMDRASTSHLSSSEISEAVRGSGGSVA